MQYIERFKRFRSGPERLKIEPRGGALRLVSAILEEVPEHSGAIDQLARLIEERQGQLVYQELPTVAALFDFIKDKRALLDLNGRLTISEEETPGYLHGYLNTINSRRLWPVDVKATVDKAFFVLIHPSKKGKRWASVAHHNFTAYRGDMFGPGWAEPKYRPFNDNPKGYDIGFAIAVGYDPREVLDQHCPEGGNSSMISQMTFGSNQLSFSIGSQGDFRKAYVPIKVTEWCGDDICDGVWQKGWQVFGVSGGVLLSELEASKKI